MGNDQVANTNSSQSGFFGNLTNNLANLATAATPIVTALTTKGGKDSGNATKPVPTASSGLTMQTILLIGAGLLAVVLVGMMLLRGGKGK